MTRYNDRVSIWEAMEIVQKYCNIVPAVEVPAEKAVGMILAENVYTTINQPPYPRSAMDGYAIHHNDSHKASEKSPVQLSVVGVQYAGDSYFRELKPGEALRIMTGGAIPPGADAVIRQEDTDYGEEIVSIYKEVDAFQNYCPIGEDFKMGELLGEAGDVADPYLIAAAVASGIRTLKVHRKISVGILTTGNELQLPGSPLKEGKIYDSNLALLSVRLNQLGCAVETAMASEDSFSSIKEKILQMSASCDFIISTGGVSVGLKDLMPGVMEEIGAKIIFHGISIKPGMPTMFSIYEDTPILSLSGNPYSAAAVFELLIKPCLTAFSGGKDRYLSHVDGIAQDSYPKKVSCTRFLRGYYDNGKIYFSRQQRNGQTKAGIGCNCLIHLEKGREGVQKGDSVEAFLLYRNNMI